VTENIKYNLRVANPWAADRPNEGWLLEGFIIMTPLWPPNDYPFNVYLIMASTTSFALPACLPSKDYDYPAGDDVLVTGWGYTDEVAEKRPSKLQVDNSGRQGVSKGVVCWQQATCPVGRPPLKRL
jgi:hypothetical protein